MQFRILGPVTVMDEAGAPRPLGPPRQHALLAALLLHRGEPIPVGRLISLLWGDAAPSSAATIVHGSVAGLRRALEPAGPPGHGRLLVTQPSGYALRVAAEQVDAARFEGLVAEGRTLVRDDPRRASELLAQALSLWHGPALAGVGAPFAIDAADRLGELRLGALEARAGADLALGRHADLVGELGELVKQHPLRERLWAQLMVALYQCGRQSDALAAYQAARRLLAEELGVRPGPELESVQHAVLRHHPSLGPPGAARTRPALPRPLGEFVGRQRESGQLVEMLDRHRLVSLVGAAGVGKSRLAVEVAHSVTGQYPGGDLVRRALDAHRRRAGAPGGCRRAGRARRARGPAGGYGHRGAGTAQGTAHSRQLRASAARLPQPRRDPGDRQCRVARAGGQQAGPRHIR